jgi:hypothetical protein
VTDDGNYLKYCRCWESTRVEEIDTSLTLETSQANALLGNI